MVRSSNDAPAPPLAPGNLTEEQRRGAACAHCGAPLSARSAVDLGSRPDADGVRIFPRACPRCAATAR
ncbi:hypothetical protein GCM10023082_26480 [Streptomyces tremellae]|uniref:Small CPxCG-related zinc finger protein n=1 Tax=Streptomyces tremellae TaxID=1124239 RepID=A0ABP7EXF2_9ACTN